MGTNYYLEAQSPCECCGRPYQALHIGKSSAGWCFSLHVIPEEGIKTLDDWKKKWEGKRIFNEYDDDVPPEEMLDTITNRAWKNGFRKIPFGYADWESFHIDNHSEPGPNGLLRHRLSDHHCIGHGEGTWDYIIGDFS